MLATSLRRLVAAAQAPPSVSARVPTDRRTVTAEAALIERLAASLADVNTPVEARSVALVHILVSDAGSPLYRDGQPAGDDLHRRLTQVLFETREGCVTDERCRSNRLDGRLPGGHVRRDRRIRASLMAGSDIFGLVVSILLFVYLCYALFRGENL